MKRDNLIKKCSCQGAESKKESQETLNHYITGMIISAFIAFERVFREIKIIIYLDADMY